MQEKKALLWGLMIIVALFAATMFVGRTVQTARADYTGPNRRSHTTGGYHNVKMSLDDSYVCTYIYTCGDNIGDIPGVRCSSGVCASLASGSTYYYVEDVPGHTVTDPPATADGSFNCTTGGNNGWCRDGNLTFTANEPVSGYVISAIETDLWGYVCQPNTASPSCTYDPGDGSGTVTFWAESTYGDSSTQHTLSWQLDGTPPTLPLSTPPPDGNNGWFISSPVAVDASGNDATSGMASLQCRVDGGAWQAPPVSVSGDGSHSVDCQAEDQAGNTTTRSGGVAIDTTAPSAAPSTSGTLGNNGWYTSPATVAANASDATSGVSQVVHQVDGGGWQNGSSVTLSSDGTHSVVFQVTDVAGNVTTTTATSVKVDTTAPTLTPSVPAPDGQNGWYATAPVNIDASGSDATSGLASVQCRVDGGAWQAPPVAVSGDGSHTVECRAEDQAGNIETWSTTVPVDTVPPLTSFSMPAENATVWGGVTLQGQADDPASGPAATMVSTDNGATWQPATLVGSQWTFFWDTRPLPDGDYTLQARTNDVAGNEEHTAILHVTVANAPPAVHLSPLEWGFWETGHADISPNPYIPVKRVEVVIQGPAGFVRKWKYGAVQHVDIHWDGRWYSEDGEDARPGTYTVVVRAWDVYGHSGEAEGHIVIPQMSVKATPTATLSPTPTPTATPMPTATSLPPTATQIPPTPTEVHQAPVVKPTEMPLPPAPTYKQGHNLAGKAAAAGVGILGFLGLLAGRIAWFFDPRPAALARLGKEITQLDDTDTL